MKQYRRIMFASACALFVLGLIFKFDVLARGENIYEQIQRFMEVMQAVNRLYVEDVDSQKMVDGAIRGMLEELDPHTVYIPKEQLKEINEQFEGEFEGIGVEFIVNNKFPTIVSPMADSPAEKLGLRPGDQIVKIDGQSTYGFSEEEVRKKLLGAKGSKVIVQILRSGFEDPFEVTITRDRIPVYSITASFMLDDKTGYIKVGLFSKTTGQEFDKALRDLETKGMKQLILDLRGNSGGYLEQAVEMVDKFMEGRKLIVYTRGRIPNSNEDYHSSGEAGYPGISLVVLIDHGSASAAEIVAGALQDWDRGLIVGVTSFGKGLVQQQILLKDGSAVRVTTARYYTPSGRLIQRAYDRGLQDYYSEGRDDLDTNMAADSSSQKPVFLTSGGRKVFGGGGISPDVMVKPTQVTLTTIKLIQGQVFFEYGSAYASKHRELAGDFAAFRDQFQVDEQMMSELLKLARSKGIEINDAHLKQDLAFINLRIKSQVARNLWGAREYYQIEVRGDPQISEAAKLFTQAAKIAGLKMEG